MDGEDGNELKIEKKTDSEMVSAESRQKLNTKSSLCNKYISYLVSGLSGMLYV